MSIKIYVARRMPLEVFASGLLPAHRQAAYPKAIQSLCRTIDLIPSEAPRAVLDTDPTWNGTLNDPLTARIGFALRIAIRCETSSTFDGIDVSSGGCVWFQDGHAHVIPIGGERYGELPDVPGSVDFSYWNNSDEPEDVSEEDWAARRDFWEAMTDAYRWESERVTYYAVRLSEDVGLWPILRGLTMHFYPQLDPDSREFTAKLCTIHAYAYCSTLRSWVDDNWDHKRGVYALFGKMRELLNLPDENEGL